MISLCKGGIIKEAECMIQRGQNPILATYNWLMQGYCLRGQMNEAMKVFNALVGRGLHANFGYNFLLNRHCKNIYEAVHLFQ